MGGGGEKKNEMGGVKNNHNSKPKWEVEKYKLRKRI